jgi:nucleoid-associated protein YgaU
MTSDAKIGLLLGLVFIFVIAFIINGLPNLKPQSSRADVTHNIVPVIDENLGVAGRTTRAHEELDWRTAVALQETPVARAESVAEPPRPAVEIPSPEMSAPGHPEIRFESQLPRIEAILEQITAGLQSPREPVSTVSMDPVRPVAGPPAGSERQPPVQAPQPRPAEPVTRTVEQPRPAERTYVVGEGENLSSVAKKVYGPEEGNRIVNVNRIFEANRDVLSSINEVKAGQRLVIPPPAPNPDKPADVLPKEQFEKVEAVGRRASAQAAATPPVESRWYTVQDGDNLWKIARTQLGAGARYEEISKLNTDILQEGKPLPVGTQIRLPLK